MDSAMASGNQDLAESLLKYFVEKDMKECFAACLYTCYDLIRSEPQGDSLQVEHCRVAKADKRRLRMSTCYCPIAI
eukprot:s4281_g8.t1